MGLITRGELAVYKERVAVGDVPRLCEAVEGLLDIVEDKAPELARAARIAELERQVAELEALAAGRAHLAHDSAPERAAAVRAELEGIVGTDLTADGDPPPKKKAAKR